MNKIVTSKSEIVEVGKIIVAEAGIQGLNVREVAKRCEVSVGTIYNYFPTKSDLIIATIGAIWKEIMKDFTLLENADFIQSIDALFQDIRHGLEKYPNFFIAHTITVMGEDKIKGREYMNHYFLYMKEKLVNILEEDKKIKETAFSDKFTKEQFVDFVLENLVMSISREEESCDILLEIITRTIYEKQ